MKHRNVLCSLGTIGIMMLFPGTYASAQQDCERCDDSDWTEVVCRDAEWNEMGEPDECTLPPGEVGDCPGVIFTCWGNSENQLALMLSIRADGTLVQPEVNVYQLVPTVLTGIAEDIGFSADARLQERTCKGLITARVYGKNIKSTLVERSQTLVI